MSGKIRTRLAVLTALGAMIALMAGATAAQADPMKYLIVDVSPSTATTLVEKTFTVDVTNSPNNNTELGAIEITSPFDITGGITIFGTFDANDGALAKSWTLAWDGTSKTFRLTADTQTDRLDPGQYLSVEVTATPPAQTSDTSYDWLAVGRQANTFNDNVDGNIVSQNLKEGSYTTVVTGTAVNCAHGPCQASQSEAKTTVTVSADCGNGILVVDTTLDVDPNQIGAAAFFSYFLTEGGENCEGRIATVDFEYSKVLISSPGGLEFAADYGSKNINAEFGFPTYTNGDPFPSCNANKGITVNCVEFVKGGSTTVSAEVEVVLTDPLSYGHK